MEQVVKLFAEYCPACSNPEYINEVPTMDSVSSFLSNVQLLEFSICPKCKQNKKELFSVYPNELVSCLGQRSGKTALAGGVIFPYILHRFLKLANPTRYLGLMPSTMLQMTMVAVSATQAYETLWLATSSTITSAPWFKEYHKALKEEEKAKGLSPGTLVRVLDTFIWYGNKKISVTYQAADMKTLRGRTRIAAGIDELAWFNDAKSVIRANPEETYTALDNSLRTVRNSTDELWARGDFDVPTAYMLNISSPRSQYDKMMRLLKQAQTDNRKAAFHYASWEASPTMSRESLRSVEINTPVKFWRDFGAQPPLADNPFIGNKNAIYATKTGKTPVFQTKPIYVKDKAGSGKFIAAEVVSCDTDRQTARIITCDAGESGNCFAVSLHHIEQNDNETKIILDGTVSVAPEKLPESDNIITIHFPTMFEVVLHLCKHFNVKYVIYDRWNSISEVQRLRDLKITAERYSPKFTDFLELRNLIDSESYKTPRWEYDNLEDLDITNSKKLVAAPYTHLALQMATVQENGKKVTKPEQGDDDIFRTLVLASRYLLLYKEIFLRSGLGNAIRPQNSVGIVIRKTGGGGSSNYSIGGHQGAGHQIQVGVIKRKTK
jgi:hypothetical protein